MGVLQLAYIDIRDLTYSYQVFEKQSGFKGSLNDFFHRNYQDKIVLDHLLFSIEKGEKVGLLGPNGAGKSTLIKLLTGILYTKQGQITVDHVTPDTKNDAFLEKIGVVMGQKSQLNWNLPARDTFNVLKSIYGIAKADYEARLNKYVTMFRVEKVVDIPVRKLSLGERTKLELISALLHGPELLILDEPTLGMDIVSQRELHQLINQVNQIDGVTVLIISHQMNDIQAVADRVLILLEGAIKFDGSIDELTRTAALDKPKIIVAGKKEQPIVASENVGIKENQDTSVIDTYDANSTITLNVQDIQSVHVQNPSLEDALYAMFGGKDGTDEISQ